MGMMLESTLAPSPLTDVGGLHFRLAKQGRPMRLRVIDDAVRLTIPSHSQSWWGSVETFEGTGRFALCAGFFFCG